MLSTDQRAERLVNLLAREPGEHEQKIHWLRRELALIEAEAEASFVEAEPTLRARNAKIVSLVIRYWRQEQRNLRSRGAPLATCCTECKQQATRITMGLCPGCYDRASDEAAGAIDKIIGRIGWDMPE